MHLDAGRSVTNRLLKFGAAIAVGLLLRTAVNLHPLWWMAWIAQVPMLYIALRADSRDARWMVMLAACIATSVNLPFYVKLMPIYAAVLVTIGQTLLWLFVVLNTRRVALRYKAWWIVFVYPLLWVAVDTLLAACLPDGNWGSLAYSQSDCLPLVQVAALCGEAGPLFLLTLGSSAMALALAFGLKFHKAWMAYASTVLLLAAALVYGMVRIHAPLGGSATTFGLASVDDFIGLQAPDSYRAAILQQYDRHVEALSRQGATIIVLPEKIATLTPALAQQWQRHFVSLAGEHRIWLEAGIALDDGQRRLNLSWLFSPDGVLVDTYQKHYLAPPERHQAPSVPPFEAGRNFAVRTIGAQRVGLAICKDMHFAALGRAYGKRQATLMLVPAWDFGSDGWLEARTTLWRGVENGYGVVRSAREGLLTVSDATGRVLAEQSSRSMPGATLLVTAKLAPLQPTLFTRVGDVLGWACVIVAAVLLFAARRMVPVLGPIPTSLTPAAK
jgi:apolipoprotein N-acyltransferase